jgi:hypothetical protein
VVCVDARSDPLRIHKWERLPVEGLVYTIRDFFPRDDGRVAFRLREITNPSAAYECGFVELSFFAIRFRPVVEPDISVFTAILAHLPKREVVDA